MIRLTLCFILAVAASASSAQPRDRNLSSLFSDEEPAEAPQDSARPRNSDEADSRKSPPAAKPKSVVPPQVPPRPRWYWVNVQVADRPGCIPLNEEPLSSLASHFGTASMRVVQDAKHAEGRIMSIEVQTRTGPEAYVYATSESICNRIRTAALAATKDIKAIDILQALKGQDSYRACLATHGRSPWWVPASMELRAQRLRAAPV